MSSQSTNDLIARSASSSSRGPREVYKEEKKERRNYLSRSSEESVSLEVSKETYLLASGPSDGDFVSERPLGQGAFNSVSAAPRELSSRTFAGISAQHNRTAKGIKVSVTLQTREDAKSGLIKTLTAELKRWDRVRELKPYAGDTPEFAERYAVIKQMVQQEPDQELRRRMCMGRLHQRGRRSAWVADMVVVGELDHQGHLQAVIFYYLTEAYALAMNQTLSPRQAEIYFTGGLWGNLQTQSATPTLHTIESQPFRP